MTTNVDGAPDHGYPEPNLAVPQFTLRSILTGMLLGGVLSLCNIYSGLKIGWGFNMSITAALLSYGFWQTLSAKRGTRDWNIYENNINQTAASAGASISSAGLVAPIPALTMMTGFEFTWGILAVWTFSVALLGAVVAIGLRQQMLLRENLPFPSGIATGETLREMYAKGSEAMAKIRMLLAAAGIASTLMLIGKLVVKIPKLSLPFSLAVPAAKAKGLAVKAASMKNLGFSLDPSLLMIGTGIIVGMRAALSMLIGAIIAWLIMAPYLISNGALPDARMEWLAANPDKSWFGPLVQWLLWPGVALMVTASMTSFIISFWRAMKKRKARKEQSQEAVAPSATNVPRKWFIWGIVLSLAFSIICQYTMFDIPLWVGTFAVALTFVLAIVAARVSGETGITPVGAMGKVTQLSIGAVHTPAQAADAATSNLMAANVTGGSASQCADMLHDMKTGLMIGASPRFQTLAQVFGVLAGALAGAAAYLALIPDVLKKGADGNFELQADWAAPAVQQWKAVAELLTHGFGKLSTDYPGAIEAMIAFGILGVILALLEKFLPKEKVKWVPSGAAMGIAFCIPTYYSISMFLGALISVIVLRKAPKWHGRFMIIIGAGFIVGESLTGVGFAFWTIIQDLL